MRRLMKLSMAWTMPVLLAGTLLAAGGFARAQEGPPPKTEQRVVVKPIATATTTANGQPIVLPQGNVRVRVWTYDIPPGMRLSVHKHPYQRYAYVIAGKLRVATADDSRTFDYAAGDFIVEMVDAWHYGETVGEEPVRLLVIDQVEGDAADTILFR
jgi:quercetin dioxygenase-like cupin family protein